MHVNKSSKRGPLGIILISVFLILVTGSGFILLGRELNQSIFYSVGHSIIMAGGIWIFCLIYVKFLWRKYPWESHPAIHIIAEVLGITLIANAYGLGLYQLELWLGVAEPGDNLGIQIFITLLITYLVTGIHEMVYFYKLWIRNFSKSVRLEKDNIEAKYETLKTQINPHFLFNSLNSLTNLVDDNENAVSYIQNLSEFLRYMLASRDKDLVYLHDELKVLNHYFELQKSRFLDNLVIRFEVPEKYHLYTLPPLALQMLVENCIKHNIISREKPLTISIQAGNESIRVGNNLQKKTGVESTGQGLINIVERYKYFTQKEVQIEETDKEFIVTVPLLIVEL